MTGKRLSNGRGYLQHRPLARPFPLFYLLTVIFGLNSPFHKEFTTARRPSSLQMSGEWKDNPSSCRSLRSSDSVHTVPEKQSVFCGNATFFPIKKDKFVSAWRSALKSPLELSNSLKLPVVMSNKRFESLFLQKAANRGLNMLFHLRKSIEIFWKPAPVTHRDPWHNTEPYGGRAALKQIKKFKFLIKIVF